MDAIDEILEVKVVTNVYGLVTLNNLYEFNNNIDNSLRLRVVKGHKKGMDLSKNQVRQIIRM